MRKLTILNVAMPVLAAAAFVATTLDDFGNLLAFFAFVVVILGLAVVNLIAPLVWWRKIGSRAFVPLLVLLLAGVASGSAGLFGSDTVLARTPCKPATFFRDPVQRELEVAAHHALDGSRTPEQRARLSQMGFDRTWTDSTRRIVTFAHYRFRTWHEYIYVPGDAPPDPRVHPFDRKLREHWYYRAW
jgi:hypothetical protein